MGPVLRIRRSIQKAHSFASYIIVLALIIICSIFGSVILLNGVYTYENHRRVGTLVDAFVHKTNSGSGVSYYVNQIFEYPVSSYNGTEVVKECTREANSYSSSGRANRKLKTVVIGSKRWLYVELGRGKKWCIDASKRNENFMISVVLLSSLALWIGLFLCFSYPPEQEQNNYEAHTPWMDAYWWLPCRPKTGNAVYPVCDSLSAGPDMDLELGASFRNLPRPAAQVLPLVSAHFCTVEGTGELTAVGTATAAGSALVVAQLQDSSSTSSGVNGIPQVSAALMTSSPGERMWRYMVAYMRSSTEDLPFSDAGEDDIGGGCAGIVGEAEERECG